MAKFSIECPQCGKYALASNFIFAKKKIDCACGYVINVKTERLSSVTCPHCQNTVVYDQAKARSAKCPVCNEAINVNETKFHAIEVHCPTCNCAHTVDKNANSFQCPLCDTAFSVQEQAYKEKVRNEGLIQDIKYEGPNDVFVWKSPITDFNLGSQLTVHESQLAVFFKDGAMRDTFGPGRHTLTTQNIPLLENVYKLPTGASDVFHSEIYFINMTTQMQIYWGTDSKVKLFDPASGLSVELGARGTFNLKVSDPGKLLVKLVGTEATFSQSELVGVDGSSNNTVKSKFKSLVIREVKSNLARVIREKEINVLAIDEHLNELSVLLKDAINPSLEEYGFTMPDFALTDVVTPDNDPNFRKMREQFAEKTLKVRAAQIRAAEAEAEKEHRRVEAETKAMEMTIGAEAEATRTILESRAEAERMRMLGYDYQSETARMVGMEAMKNGLGGESGSGLASSILGLGVGMAAVGTVAGATKDAMAYSLGNAPAPAAPGADTWDCACGAKGNKTAFCPNCGNKRPAPVQADTWTCDCGTAGITTKFCPNCGGKRPEAPSAWTCGCGTAGITTKFCPNCGKQRPEQIKLTWDCKCGQKDISTAFCPNCGTRKENKDE